MPTTNEQSAPPTRAASVRKHYGDDWMCEAIRTRKTSDHLTHNPRQELNMYLSSPLEETDDIVAWWGVSLFFYLFFSLLNLLNSFTRCNTLHLCALRETIYPFKAAPFLPNKCSQAEESLRLSDAMHSGLTRSLHYNY
jgi:hypothetical protein